MSRSAQARYICGMPVRRLGKGLPQTLRSETQECCILGCNILQIAHLQGWVPDFPGQSELGTTLAGEHAVSFNRRKASRQLSEVMEGLTSMLNQLSEEDAPQLLVQNTTQALRLMQASQSALNTGVDDLPLGERVSEMRVTELKTGRGRLKQAEILEFILRRVQSDGLLIPVSSKEILENTSLRTKSHVSQVLSSLIRDGKLVSYRRPGYSGYLPTQHLMQEISLERSSAHLSQ